MLTNLVDGQRWRCGHVAVRSCRVRGETVGTAEKTCDWALTVTSRSPWRTSPQPGCLPFPLQWQRIWSTVQRQVLRSWRPGSPTGTRSAAVWRLYVTTARRSLNRKWKQIRIVNSNQILPRDAMLARYILWACVRVCMCLSVTSVCSTKTAKSRIKQTTPHDSPGTLVFWRERSLRNSTGVWGRQKVGGLKSVTFDK